jgi:hypothetical protein
LSSTTPSRLLQQLWTASAPLSSLLCDSLPSRSPPLLVYLTWPKIHDGPYPRTPGTGNTGTCLRP